MQKGADGERTCWTLIQGAAAGGEEDRSEFSHRYLPVVRAVFSARWRGLPLKEMVDDAVQEVFLECFRSKGVLEKADPTQPRGFRAFLFGVVTNVALRIERQRARQLAKRAPGSFHPEEMSSHEERLSKLFDRAWAVSVIQQAGELQRKLARKGDDGARQRVELLELRFQEGLPIREIAARWEEDAASVHAAYRKARKEYSECLREVVGFNNPGTPEETAKQCERLLALLG